MQTKLMPGGTPREDRVGFWITPAPLYRELWDEFHFDYDPCPFPRPDGYDGLTAEWGTSNYVNPPFRGPKMKWVRKCIEEWKKGKVVVLILGSGNLSHVFDILPDGTEIRVVKGVRWENPAGDRCPFSYTALLFVLPLHRT